MSDPYDVAAYVLSSIEGALDAVGRKPATSYVNLGSSAIVDDCCAGLLTVGPEAHYRTVPPFPTVAGADEACRYEPIAVDLLVTYWRCTAPLGERGQAPAPATVDQIAQTFLRDCAVIWNTLAGDAILTEEEWERAGLRVDYTPEQGGCQGAEFRVTFGVPSSTWCTDWS